MVYESLGNVAQQRFAGKLNRDFPFSPVAAADSAEPAGFAGVEPLSNREEG
jgi:hypothetical protein